MKKIILSALAMLALANVNAQFEIRYNGQGDDLAGTIYDVDVTPGTLKEVKLWVLNTGNTDEDIYITRVRQDVPAGWLEDEQMCWPPYCYPWTASADVHTTPTGASATVTTTQSSQGLVSTITSNPDTTITEMKPSVTASSSATGSALFMYYLTASNGDYLDSVGVRYNTGISSIKETQKLDISVAPNPASNNLTVDFDGANSAELKMVDVLGNVVLTKTISGKETIDVSNFRNGIYFVAISSEGRKPVVRKVIVRH